MHVIVPTLDLVVMLSKLRPMRSLVTSGFQFAIYTLEAYQDKLKLIVSDRTSITATMEIFANVKKEGRISVNGTDFYESIIRIVPDSKSNMSGSKQIILKGSDVQLEMSTTTYYTKLDTNIKQERTFDRVATDLSVNQTDLPGSYHIQLEAKHLSEILKTSSRLISTYTSDMAGLSGVLLRVRGGKVSSVVSDGMRILEVIYPNQVVSVDFDVILPKITVTLLQGLIEEGDKIDIYADGRQIKFVIDSNGLETYISSRTIRATFPEYAPIFASTGDEISVNVKMFSDNISNIRKSLNDDTYRVRLKFDGTNLLITNTKTSSHVKFSNEGIPVRSNKSMPFDILINAFLLEGLLSILKSDYIHITIPPDNKPIVIKNIDEDILIRTAIALPTE